MSFAEWLGQLDFTLVWDYAIIIAASMLCIMFHEVSHGLCALALGDTTAKEQGRLSFNPLRHVDLWGLLMMAIFKFGWAKAVPIDSRRFKKPIAGMAITALAGPLSNVVLAYLALCVRAGAVYFFVQSGGAVSEFIILFTEYVAILSIGLSVFNIIPIPPLDGSKVLFALLPRRIYYRVLQYERYGFIILIVLLYLGWLDTPLNVCRSFLIDILSSAAAFPYYIFERILG